MKLLRLVLGVCCVATPLNAQVTAAISGSVEDASGARVYGATVTVKNLETGASRSVNTNESGNYILVSLPLGRQELKAGKAGFKTAVRTGVDLVVGQEAVVNFQLELGDLVQQVTVAGGTPLVNTTTSAVSGVVG